MFGINTLLSDNPSLTTRLKNKEGNDPTRIIIDSKGRIPVDSNVISVKSKAGVILATTSNIPKEKELILLDKGVKIIKCENSYGQVDLSLLMDELYNLEIDSVLLEGGGTLNASALDYKIVDKIVSFIAPKIIGGKDALTPIEGKGIQFMGEAIELKHINIERFGDDIMIEGYVQKHGDGSDASKM